MKILLKNTNFCKFMKNVILGTICFLFLVTSCSSEYDEDPPYRVNTNREAKVCAQKIAKDNKIDYLFVGSIHDFYNGLFFKSHKFINLNDGRILIKDVTDEYINQIYNSKFIYRNIKYREEIFRKKKFNKNNIENYFTIRISFWDEKYDKPKLPYLSEIYLCEGQVYFYQADPITQEKVLISQEPFEELRKMTQTKYHIYENA